MPRPTIDPPPPIDGVHPSRLQVPQGSWRTVLEALCACFPAIDRNQWLDRMARGRVLDAHGEALTPQTRSRTGLEILYYREVADEPRNPFEERVLHVDAHLVVADKPHFLPVTPAGRFVRETLLARLVRRLGNPDLVPLHRIDRETAGLVLFSADPATRAQYQALFRERGISKSYEAIAAPLPDREFPLLVRSRLERGEPFFRMREVEGAPNADTRVAVIERGIDHWRYALHPITGRKHQLRVHMAAIGAPIFNDALYPVLRADADSDVGDANPPLRLLAKSLAFIDPVSGAQRRFESGFAL